MGSQQELNVSGAMPIAIWEAIEQLRKKVKSDQRDCHPDDFLDRILSFQHVCSTLDISRTTLWRLIKSGDFPTPIQISPGRRGISARELHEFIEARKAEARSLDQRIRHRSAADDEHRQSDLEGDA